MNGRVYAEAKATQKSSFNPVRTGLLQRSSISHARPITVPPIVQEVLRSPGQPIDPATRASMESWFGHDFSQVRVHTDSKAAESARAVNALAYTVGRNVAFDAGQYTPQTPIGQMLLAHELTHVLQQGNSDTTRPTRLSAETDHHEREASAASINILTDPAEQNRPVVTGGVEPGTVQRGWPLLVAVGAGILGGIYAIWAYSCLSPLLDPMCVATFGSSDSTGMGGFRLWYYDQTGSPVPSNVWDAFGHCWIACESTQHCGALTAAIAGKGYEFCREYIDSEPHDSYEQDTNNQTLGRGFGSQGRDCTASCRNAALPGGAMDLSAPQVEFWTLTLGTYTP